MKFYAEINKIDEDQRLVYGYASTEALDFQGERVSKSAIQEALPDYLKFSNIREMHQASAVGVAEEATIDEKGLYLVAKIVDDNAWKKVKEGVYKGFSIGGKRLAKVDDTITKLRLTEISLVDRPANPQSVFDVFKSDSVDEDNKKENSEMEKIAEREDVNPKEGEKKYGKVKFADPKNKKYPIDTEEHVRAAWNYINQTKNADKYNSSDASSIKRRILAAWKDKIGGEPPSAEKDTEKTVSKGLYTVGCLANLIAGLEDIENSVTWEADFEQDGSELPKKLRIAVENLGNILRDMVVEETDELNESNDIENAQHVENLAKNEESKMNDEIKKQLSEISTALGKVMDQNKQLVDQNSELSKRVQELEAQPINDTKGYVNDSGVTRISKAQDNGAIEDDLQKMIDAETDNSKKAALELKKIYQDGGYLA